METSIESSIGEGIWRRGREQVYQYAHRHPESTNLYRLIYQYGEALELSWEPRFQSKYGVFRTEVKDTLRAYLDCGILEQGGALIVCDKCKHSEMLAFSCRKRGICPSCGAKHAVIFAEHMYCDVLAPVKHRHMGFTIPKRLRPYLLFHRELSDVLFRAARRSIAQMYESVLPGCKAGAVMELHSHGDELNWHPHIHSIATDGAFDPQGRFHELSLDMEQLGLLFGQKVLRQLKKYYADIPGLQEACEQISNQEHSGFGAWAGEVINPEDRDYQLFLSRYIDRNPVAESKIELEGDKVKYLGKDGAMKTFDVLDFLAQLTMHVPKKWESRRRYIGYYSHRDRGRRKKEEETKLQEQAAAAKAIDPQGNSSIQIIPATPERKRKASRRWAELIKRIFNVDPLLCPRCGSQMRIKSFITDPHEIKKLLIKLGIAGWTKPEPIRKHQPGDEQFYDPLVFQ